jgi:hypothetical protein
MTRFTVIAFPLFRPCGFRGPRNVKEQARERHALLYYHYCVGIKIFFKSGKRVLPAGWTGRFFDFLFFWLKSLEST